MDPFSHTALLFQLEATISHTGLPTRIDIWFHGRGENLSEVNFINDSQRSMGEFAPVGAFVLRPYGRYCNPNRFAGETDTFEALDAIRKAYGIDVSRIAVRVFFAWRRIMLGFYRAFRG